MVSILKATEKDGSIITSIGRAAVEEAHRDSCSDEIMKDFLDSTYNERVIGEELNDPKNIYHIIQHHGITVGFSKIILNAGHPNIGQENVTKLDRIYLLKEFYGFGLGYNLLQFNIELSKKNNQSGMWLFTWVGNSRAVNFYGKTGFSIIGSHQFKVTGSHYNLNHQMYLSLI